MPLASHGMGSGQKKVVWALCFLLLLLEVESARNNLKRNVNARGSWEEPGTEAPGAGKFWEQPLHAGQAQEMDEYLPPNHDEECPPSPRWMPHNSCRPKRCHTHSDCSKTERCCYNGCIFTCMNAVPPPPVIDWLEPPKPQQPDGQSWIVDGPVKTPGQAMICSTAGDGEEPVPCPTGYECHILIPSDEAKGLPSLGHCISEHEDGDDQFHEEGFPEGYKEYVTKNVAEHSSALPRQSRVKRGPLGRQEA